MSMDTEALEALRAIAAIAEKYGFELEAFLAAVKELGDLVREGW